MIQAGYIVLALVIVALNAFFVATEFAIVRVRATRVEELVGEGARRAMATQHVLRRLDSYLSSCQLGITLTSLALGWIGEPAFAHLLEPLFSWAGSLKPAAVHSAALTLSFLLITFLHTVFGELVPKSVAIQHAEGTALALAWPLRVFTVFFYPLIWFLNGSANLVVRLIGLEPASEVSLAHSEAELRMILSVSRRTGALAETHARLLANALDFTDRSVRQIVVPRGDVVFLDVRREFSANLATARESGHTRYPLCEGDIDNVVGVIHLKDLFLSPVPDGAPADLHAIARKPLFIPETVTIDRAVTLFQQTRMHLGVVIDEHGGTTGIVTLEDVVEELLGEIQDEFDQEAPKVQVQTDGRLFVDASIPLNEIEEYTGIPDPADTEVDTLGGLVFTRLGRIAHVGDAIVLDGRRVQVARVRGRRIVRLLIDPPKPRPVDGREPGTAR